jgi:hypothetical protein
MYFVIFLLIFWDWWVYYIEHCDSFDLRCFMWCPVLGAVRGGVNGKWGGVNVVKMTRYFDVQ